ncbi:MAG TPA: peptidoglycan-binding domain-containing protein [Candidatus Acidoferrum sp.]|nr:peptidoglycan-binding domain-containing protein [Candidatus Acidoferrum sp.]
MQKAIRLALTLLVVAGMSVTGVVAAAQTARSSKSATVKRGIKSHHGKSSRRSVRRVRGQKSPTSDRISEIQSALAKDGSFNGSPDGKWDDATVEAIKKFQGSHGLNPSGKLDAKTLQKLGLGSQTAGLAPPMPPVSSSSLTASPSATVPRRQ